ncbi:hypothetical protein GJV44_00012 [Candidatus Vallotia cooleyia]|nr:hypothetical protein GJV44_00012 [Candidatus Vallotia cooleyia]
MNCYQELMIPARQQASGFPATLYFDIDSILAQAGNNGKA